MRLLPFVLALAALSSCGKLPPNSAGLGEACFRSADCAEPFTCQDGQCALAAERACEPAAKRCNGDTVEKCRTGGDGWDAAEPCATGCVAGACREQACEPGMRKCEGGVILECVPSGAGWSFFTSCVTSCDPARAECTAPVCNAFETRCKPAGNATLQTCNARGTAFVDTACSTAAGAATCLDGRCEALVCSTLGEQRCRGDVLEDCNVSGTAFEASAICEFGCTELGASAACAEAACESGSEACETGAIVRCTPDRRGRAFVQFCPAGCAINAGRASCLSPACTPLARRCATSTPVAVEQCRGDGSGYDPVESCPQSCVAGSCVVTESGCVPGERRCQGRESEVCVRVSNGATEWRFEDRCLGTCMAGACEGASCGCAGGAGVTVRCGEPGRLPLTLRALVPSGSGALPSDGVSRFLLVSDVIASSSGEWVPDGTPVTLSHDGAEVLFASADQDPSRPGLQRLTLSGRVDVVLKAPATPRTVAVSGSLAGRCAGTLPVVFAAATGAPRLLYVAEDFSTTRLFDRAGSTAAWDAPWGRALALPSFDLGTGLDGDLTVAANQTRDLWAEGYAKGWNALALGDADALLETAPAGLAPGDEVLVLGVSGASASAVGTYEFRRVLGIEGPRVLFDQALRGLYGPVSNRDLADQRVVVQRVPQLNNVTVEIGGKLTARSLVTGGSGALALRARGVVRILGSLTMAESGLAVGAAQTSTSTAALNRLLAGAGAAKAGGGIVFLAGGVITLRTEASPNPVGTISAASTGGAGGTVWLQGGALTIGSDRVTAAGSTAAGRVRLDSGTEASPLSTPAPFVGQNGASLVQSLAVFEQPLATPQPLVRAATVVGVLGGSASARLGAVATIPGVTLEVSADDGGNWTAIDTQLTFGKTGRQFRWRARLATPTDVPNELSGLAFRLEVN